MRSYQRVLVFLLLVLLLTSLLSPWVAALWNFIIEARPGWEEYRYSFSRIFDRLFMILAILLFFFCRPLLKIQSPGQLGLRPLRQGYSDLLRGFFLALASVIALGFFMSLAEIFTPYFRLSLSVALERSVKALLAAVTVGFLEEIFFRGMIFKGLLEDLGLKAAFLLASLFYSAIHFIKPAEAASADGFDPWAGIDHLIRSFQSLFDPDALFPGLLGLFFIGAVLSYAYLRTGSLYLSIGLHAGWIFGLKTIRVFGDYRREDLGWLFGSSEPKLISGVAGWIGIITVGIIIHYLTRRREGLKH
ncbi:MAG: CPBP family intramembrane metalloprotease [Deltaproteobacteria bacterium]|nr:CPBP family intramembrane metalloprotease [Deltaproteobacteria bacterium]